MFIFARSKPTVIAAFMAIITAFAIANASSQPLQGKLVTVSSATPFPIGIDYSPTLDKLIVSVNYINGTPFNFDTLTRGGVLAQFSNVSGLTNEIYLTTVRDTTAGGFLRGETYFAMGLSHPGQIGKLDAVGNATTPWLTLPAGFTDLGFRGGIHVDRTGAFGGDLLLLQSNDTIGPARVWRVRSVGGVAMLIDTSGSVFANQALATPIYTATVHLEGLTTVPNDPKYGPWAGTLLTGAEFVTPQPIIVAIRPNGTVADSRVLLDDHGTPIKMEDCEVLAAGYDLYMTNYNGTANSKIVSLKAPDLANNGGALGSAVGDVIIAAEFPPGGAPNGNVFQVRWNPNTNAFNVVTLASVSQIEHITTAPELAAIKGTLWCDDNRSGALDPGEGLPNVTVTLTGTDFNGNAVNKNTTTASDGTYLFDNLLPGTYSVTAPNTDGDCTNTSENPCTHTIAAGETAICDFKYVPPPPGNGATRTWGFYKTHLQFMQTYNAASCVNLGKLTLTNGPPQGGPGQQDLTNPGLPEIEAIFWTSPGKDTSAVGQARLQLAHQLIAAQINVCVIGTTSPQIVQLIADAVSALDGTDATLMNTLEKQLDTFNSSGDSKSLPNGLQEFTANPNGSKALATPTGPGPGFK